MAVWPPASSYLSLPTGMPRIELLPVAVPQSVYQWPKGTLAMTFVFELRSGSELLTMARPMAVMYRRGSACRAPMPVHEMMTELRAQMPLSETSGLGMSCHKFLQ